MRNARCVLPWVVSSALGCNALSGVDELRFETPWTAGGGDGVAAAGGAAGSGGGSGGAAGGPPGGPSCDEAPVPIGTPCEDGSLYAGLSPDGDVDMYTTRCDVGMVWNGTTCTGDRDRLEWGSDGTFRNITDKSDGDGNTAALAAFGQAAHPAAYACPALGAGWYLPAEGELTVLYDNRAALGNFYVEGCGARYLACYWSSSEDGAARAWRIDYANGSHHNAQKYFGLTVRCVRK